MASFDHVFHTLVNRRVIINRNLKIKNESRCVKACTNGNIGNAATSPCGLQVVSTMFILPSPGNDAKTKANAGDILSTHANSKSSNPGGNGKGSQNDIPFALPFP